MIKAIMVPLVIGFITWLSKRVSPQVAGMLAGMPITGGPILLLLSLDQGTAYASNVALATASSVAAMSVAMLCMSITSGWWAGLTMLLATLVYFISAWIFSPLLLVTTLLISMVIWLMAPKASKHLVSPPNTLAVRMLTGFLLTLFILWISPRLSASWAGILAGYPFAAMIIAMFIQHEQGKQAAQQFSLGALQAMATTGVFYWLLGEWLPSCSYAAFALALGVLLLINVAILQVVSRLSAKSAQ